MSCTTVQGLKWTITLQLNISVMMYSSTELNAVFESNLKGGKSAYSIYYKIRKKQQ